MMRLLALSSLILLGLPLLPATAETKSDIEYAKAGDVSLTLDAHIPDGEGPFPVVIVIHGGGWMGGNKAQGLEPITDPLKGKFTWFSISYRFAPQHRWPACYEDVKTAIAWVKQHAAEFKGDPTRIALMGYSAGGQLACLAATQGADETKVQAVIGIAPPTDFEQDLAPRGGLSKPLQALLDRPQEVTDESRKMLQQMSPLNHVKPGLCPFLIIQGADDKSVPLEQAMNFQARCKENNVSCDVIAIKGAGHGIRDWDQFDPSYREKIAAWLLSKLEPPQPQ